VQHALQNGQGGPVGPLQIVDCEHDGNLGTLLSNKRDDRIHQSVAQPRRIQRVGDGLSAQQRADVGSRWIGGVGRQSERSGNRGERPVPLVLMRDRRRDPHPTGLADAQRVGEQPRLPDSRFALDQQHAAVPGRQRPQVPVDDGTFAVPPNKRNPDVGSQVGPEGLASCAHDWADRYRSRLRPAGRPAPISQGQSQVAGPTLSTTRSSSSAAADRRYETHSITPIGVGGVRRR
jgi:hypothetical protein